MKAIFLILSLAILFACNKDSEYLYHDDLPAIKRGSKAIAIRSFLSDAKIDIVWIVDNSGSMSDIQQNIVTNSAQFIETFLKHSGLKWNMGIISTDTGETPYLGFVGEKYDWEYLKKYGADQTKSTFANAIQSLGTNGSYDEVVFYNLDGQLTRFPDFLSEDAHLAVIMVSDEEEQSVGRGGGQYSAGSFENMIRGYMSKDKNLRFYGALSAKDLEGCQKYGPAYAGSPFESIIDNTGGFNLSACINFGEDLARIGDDIISMLKVPAITLKDRPKLDTLKVLYDGTPLPYGPKDEGGAWWYSERFNTVNFYNLDFAPDFSDEILEVIYDIDDGYDRTSEKKESNETTPR